MTMQDMTMTERQPQPYTGAVTTQPAEQDNDTKTGLHAEDSTDSDRTEKDNK